MNITETKLVVKTALPREAIILKGGHGLGKSEVMAQIAAEMSIEQGVPYQFIDQRLSQKEVGDIIGMPRAVESYTGEKLFFENGKLVKKHVTMQNVTVYNPPDWFPTDPDSHGILFLDELNRATREVQQAAFELVLDYRLNFKDLPQGWLVVAAINDDTELYSVLDMDIALESRFLQIPFEPTVEEWMSHAKDIGVHDAIIKYLTKFDSKLDIPEKIEPGKIYPNRRSWVKLSKRMDNMAKLGHDLMKPDNSHLLIKVANGYVGSIAVQFEDFIRKDYKVLTAEDILNKYDDDLDRTLSKMGVTELSYYNKILVEHIKEKGFSIRNVIQQHQNLSRYIHTIPKELAANLWISLLSECRSAANAWYQRDKEIGEYIYSILGTEGAI